MKRFIMEFLGTFFLILAVALTGNAIAIGAMLMAWIYIGSHITAAHYNPAVSFAALLIGKVRREEFIKYFIAQILGGLVAYILAANLHGSVAIPAPSIEMLPAFLVEVLLSFVFVLLVLVVVYSERFKGSHISGFAIGFAIPALLIVGSPLSGGLFNPAIALGSNGYALFKGMHVIWGDVLMYGIGALFGGFLASSVYKNFGLEEKK